MSGTAPPILAKPWSQIVKLQTSCHTVQGASDAKYAFYIIIMLIVDLSTVSQLRETCWAA